MKRILIILSLCSLFTLQSTEINTNPPGGPAIYDKQSQEEQKLLKEGQKLNNHVFNWRAYLHSSTSGIGGRLFDITENNCYYKKLTWRHSVIIEGTREIANEFVKNMIKYGNNNVFHDGINHRPNGFYVIFTTTMDDKEFQELINKVSAILNK